VNALEVAVRRYRSEVDMRRRAYRARSSSEGLWTRVAVALALSGPKGLYRVTKPPQDGVLIGSFASISGRSLEVFMEARRPDKAIPVSLEEVLQEISSSPRKRRSVIVCVVPPSDESGSSISDTARILGCRGGRSTSSLKAAAARQNGRKGGRPPVADMTSGRPYGA
jgi:hypothetical protein